MINWRHVLVLGLICIATKSFSQSDPWSAATKKQQQKIQQAGNTIKSWKAHLELWGLDSNYNHAFAIGG